jgi:hypothetical protein
MEYTPGSVGMYGGYNTDFWGFYNGRMSDVVPGLQIMPEKYVWHTAMNNTFEQNTSGYLEYTTPFFAVGSKQERTTPYDVVPGIIKKLQYPTGGFAEFLFETNQYESSFENHKVYGGGCRIRQIKYGTGDGRDSVVKVYKYGFNENGMGRTRYKNYDKNFALLNYTITQRNFNGNVINERTKITTVNSKPHLSMSFASGAGILYPEVAEYAISLPDSVPLGKTVYNYYIDSHEDYWLAMTPIHADSRQDWKAISLMGTAVYRYQNNQFDKIKNTAYEYTNFYIDTLKAAQSYLRFHNPFSYDPMFNYQFYTTDPVGRLSYDIYTGTRKVTGVMDTTFVPGIPGEYVATNTLITYEPKNYYKSRLKWGYMIRMVIFLNSGELTM